MIMGKVKSLSDSSNALQYVLCDPEDEDQIYKVSHYKGTDGGEMESFSEDSRIMVAGKLRSLNQDHGNNCF